MSQYPYPAQQPYVATQQRFMTQVFGWMTLGLTVTGFVALAILANDGARDAVNDLMTGWSILLVFGVQLGLVLYLSARIDRLSPNAARALFLAYAASIGLTFAVIFAVYTTYTIVQTFFISAGTFALMFFVGWTTKRDLTRLGSLAIMAIWGIILATVVNLFLGAPMLELVISWVGVLVFVGLTAYDAQNLKRMQEQGFGGGVAVQQKAAILGALRLYLDFVNLFLFLLRILGDRR